MMRFVLLSHLALAVSGHVSAQRPDGGLDDPSRPVRWFATFSIIAFDPATNDLGVAVQSHAFSAGAAVPYAIPGVGAVATQAAANRLYGPKAIELLKQGLSPADVVKRLTEEDPGRDTRQLAVIDAKGRSAVHTGKHVIDRNSDVTDFIHLGGYAGHIAGQNFSVQGNTLASEDVLKNMARAYEQGKGTMAERLMDALDAGQAAGGDTRGMQSAGLLVVRPVPPGSNVVVDRIVDLRVDDAVDPFKELRRLLNINLGIPRKLTDQSSELARAGKFDEAIALAQKALEIQPNSDTLHYALAQRYAQAGQPVQALVPLREAIRLHPNLARQAAKDPIFAKMLELAEFKRLIRVGSQARVYRPFHGRSSSRATACFGFLCSSCSSTAIPSFERPALKWILASVVTRTRARDCWRPRRSPGDGRAHRAATRCVAGWRSSRESATGWRRCEVGLIDSQD